MHYKVFFFLLCFLPLSVWGQRKHFAIGLQSGNNYSRTLVFNEFDNSPLRGDYFIGSSFGIVARSYLFKDKWSWGPFTNELQFFLEYGLNGTFGGYNYYFEQEATFQEQYSIQLPLLLTIRPGIQKYWYKGWKKKRIYPISKSGFYLSTTSNKTVQNQYNFGETRLIEEVEGKKGLNVYIMSAFGIQREYLNGRILYIGLSMHTPFFSNAKGTIRVESQQFNEIARVEKNGNYYSIDLQYFFGEGKPNRRKRRFGKLPKIIYNPRY